MKLKTTTIENKKMKELSKANDKWSRNLKKFPGKRGATNTIHMKNVVFYIFLLLATCMKFPGLPSQKKKKIKKNYYEF